MRTSEVIFIFIISTLPCVLTQISISISAPAIVKPSQNVKLTCHVSGVVITDGSKIHAVNIVRQFSGGRLEFLAHLNYVQRTVYNPSLQSRLLLSRDTAKNEVYLEFRSLVTDDSGTYYCTGQRVSGSPMDVWGQGTTLTVTADGIVKPQVFPLVPFHQEKQSSITIGCLAQNYMPNPLSVLWNTNSGDTLSGEKNIQFPPSGNPFSYSLVSLMTVSSSQWNSNTYICDVRHFSSSIQRTIPRGCVTPPDSPTVHILQGSCFSNTDDQVELTCQGYNLTSKDANIKWFINEMERPLPQDLLYLENSNLYALHSTVSISLAEWNNGVHVKCQVTDTKTSKSSEATARKCSDISNSLGIEVMMVPPTIENLYVQKTARIACTAYNLKQPTGSAFDFNYPGAPSKLNIQTEDPQLNLDGTYSRTSWLAVTPETWQSNKEFTCVFRFSELSDPIIKTISRKRESKMIAPSIAVFPPPPEDIAKDEFCTITCNAYDFYPQDIHMGWTEDDMEIPRDQHVNSEPRRNNRNQSFSASSLLSVPCSEWKKGKHYGCVVGHEAIPMKLMKKDIDIHTGNPTKVNVSVVLSDTTLSCY